MAATAAASHTVLVTGATGAVGRHVVNELLKRGYYVRALTSKSAPPASRSPRLQWCQLDFHSSLDFDAAVRGCIAVLHLGAEIASADRMQRSNVEATRALAGASESAGVRIFCFTSSVSVYGSSRRRRVSEDSPVLTADRDVRTEYWVDETLRCYGRTKLLGELALRAVAREVEYVILRPAVVADADRLAQLIAWTKMQRRIAASRHAHYVCVSDVVDAILWFMERSVNREQARPGLSTYNLCEDDARVRTYAQIFRTAYEMTGDTRWRVATIPWPVERIWALAKFHSLPVRHSFGRMLISSDKLASEGCHFSHGMTSLIEEFCVDLRRTTGSAIDSFSY